MNTVLLKLEDTGMNGQRNRTKVLDKEVLLTHLRKSRHLLRITNKSLNSMLNKKLWVKNLDSKLMNMLMRPMKNSLAREEEPMFLR